MSSSTKKIEYRERLCDGLNCNGTNKFGEECRDISHFDEMNEARSA